MKKKNLNKKLVLKKTAIANLKNNEMNSVNGGREVWLTNDCVTWDTCGSRADSPCQ